MKQTIFTNGNSSPLASSSGFSETLMKSQFSEAKN
jgi:hypothetical protein